MEINSPRLLGSTLSGYRDAGDGVPMEVFHLSLNKTLLEWLPKAELRPRI